MIPRDMSLRISKCQSSHLDVFPRLVEEAGRGGWELLRAVRLLSLANCRSQVLAQCPWEPRPAERPWWPGWGRGCWAVGGGDCSFSLSLTANIFQSWLPRGKGNRSFPPHTSFSHFVQAAQGKPLGLGQAGASPPPISPVYHKEGLGAGGEGHWKDKP